MAVKGVAAYEQPDRIFESILDVLATHIIIKHKVS
jgi:hypothetical protein